MTKFKIKLYIIHKIKAIQTQNIKFKKWGKISETCIRPQNDYFMFLCN